MEIASLKTPLYKRAKKPVIDNDLGLTAGEQKVMDYLMNSYHAFLDIDREHPNEMGDFVDAVHKIQGILAMRVIRRSYPEGWPTYNAEKLD